MRVSMKKYWKHYKTITKHRHLVTKLCFKCGQYKRGLLHDLSKYSPAEFISSARYFQGDHSPIEAEKAEKGYSFAWQHHKGHNPHHFEFWIDNVGSTPTPIKIPYEYCVEMVCDWIAAGIVYNKLEVDFDKPYDAPLKYYLAHKEERLFHPETEEMLDIFMNYIAEKGVNMFCKFSKIDGIVKSSYEE